MTIKKNIENYLNDGFDYANAVSKACQDIMLKKISDSNFSNNITIKGGVVLMNLSKNNRRATQDLDLDFIRYSISEESIRTFINKLNVLNDNIAIEIISDIIPLNHEDYRGKRVHLSITENNKEFYELKLDLGVHSNLNLEQEEIYFNINNYSESVLLLANSKEQIISEKLKSILRYGELTTRLKDVFDIYYLTNIIESDRDKLVNHINNYILKDHKLNIRTFNGICKRLERLFSNNVFRRRLQSKKSNWLDLPIKTIINGILNFFKELP